MQGKAHAGKVARKFHRLNNRPPVAIADTVRLDRPIDGTEVVTDLLTVNGNAVRYRILHDAETMWRTHRGTDECFLILSGEVVIDTRQEGEESLTHSHTLYAGHVLVVRPGIEHRVRSKGRATLVVVDDIRGLG